LANIFRNFNFVHTFECEENGLDFDWRRRAVPSLPAILAPSSIDIELGYGDLSYDVASSYLAVHFGTK
jgi:hypothetical protein